jgi:transposase
MPRIFRTGTGALVMAMLSGLFPFRGKVYADGGYQGGKSQAAVKRVINQINVKIVKRADAVKGLLVLPKRRAVERTLAWLNRCRRLAKDWECLNRRARGFQLLASVRLRVRRLGRNAK